LMLHKRHAATPDSQSRFTSTPPIRNTKTTPGTRTPSDFHIFVGYAFAKRETPLLSAIGQNISCLVILRNQGGESRAASCGAVIMYFPPRQPMNRHTPPGVAKIV